MKDNPKHVQSHGNLGLAFAGLGRRADALSALSRAMELDPDYQPAISNRSLIERMREGERLEIGKILDVEFYADRLRAGKESGRPS